MSNEGILSISIDAPFFFPSFKPAARGHPAKFLLIFQVVLDHLPSISRFQDHPINLLRRICDYFNITV
jgi:hypothetical protein